MKDKERRERLETYIYLFFCLLLFPFKFLDASFIGRRSMLTLAPTILVVVRMMAGVRDSQ